MWITDMQQKIEQEFVVFYIMSFEVNYLSFNSPKISDITKRYIFQLNF